MRKKITRHYKVKELEVKMYTGGDSQTIVDEKIVLCDTKNATIKKFERLTGYRILEILESRDRILEIEIPASEFMVNVKEPKPVAVVGDIGFICE